VLTSIVAPPPRNRWETTKEQAHDLLGTHPRPPRSPDRCPDARRVRRRLRHQRDHELGTTSGGGGSGTSSSGSTTGSGGAATIRIHLRANTKPFPHDDGLSGQTPLSHVSGIRSLKLLQQPGDPAPLTVFDHGSGFVEASYDDGSDTVVGSAEVSKLAPGVYTQARVVHSHVRYRVAATVHASGLDLPGEFDNVQVLSDGTTIDGKSHDHGFYAFVFKTGNKSFPTTGTNAPLPQVPSSGGFSAKLENGQWAYYFPTSVTLGKDTPGDLDVVLEVNMFESFRWEDQDAPDFAEGVFDVTPTGFEPVKQFGANSFLAFLE
jgi:hypothetical protein